MTDRFDIYARFHDPDLGEWDDDVQVYVQYAARFCSPILELGCGTGRVLLPLALQGCRLTGIDASAEMLERARAKFATENLGGLVTLVQPEMRELDLDMMQAGFAMQFGGFFLAVVGLIVTAIFFYRANRLKAMFRGSHVLAHCVYDPVQVRDQADADLRSAKERNRVLLLVVAVFVVACTLLFVAIGFSSGEGDNMPLFVGIMAAVLVVVAAFAFGMSYLQHHRALRSSGEALIAENGLYVNGALHTWNPPLATLDEVRLVEEGAEASLVFSLRSLSRTSATLYEAYSVDVPVSPGSEAAARQVEQFFRERNLPF